MKSDTWLTPPEIIEALGTFDLDPCCPEKMPWKTAATMYHKNGLTKPWVGRVWLNPPYSREAANWLAALALHGDGIGLIFARTETDWFRRQVWRKAQGILFLHGRIHFHFPDGARAPFNSGAPSCLVAYGQYNADILKDCRLSGTYLHDPPTHTV